MIRQKQNLKFDKETVDRQLKNLESAKQLAQILYDAVNDVRREPYWLRTNSKNGYLYDSMPLEWRSVSQLNYYVDTAKDDCNRLRIFNIPKRKGGFREIVAPKPAFRVRRRF